MPAILSTLRLDQSRVECYQDKIEIFDLKASGTSVIPVSYEAMFNLNRHKDSILEQLKDTEDRISRRLSKINKRGKMSARSVDYAKSELKERFNKFPNRVELQLTRNLALFVFVDFHVRRDYELTFSFVPKIMTFSRSIAGGFSRGSGIFPVGVNKGGIEGRTLRIGVLKELMAQMSNVQRTLFDFAIAHGHATACTMCRFVIGDLTTLSTVRLPASLKDVDVQKCKKELDNAFWQYINQKTPTSNRNQGSLIIVMRPCNSSKRQSLEKIESSEDEADYREVCVCLSLSVSFAYCEAMLSLWLFLRGL